MRRQGRSWSLSPHWLHSKTLSKHETQLKIEWARCCAFVTVGICSGSAQDWKHHGRASWKESIWNDIIARNNPQTTCTCKVSTKTNGARVLLNTLNCNNNDIQNRILQFRGSVPKQPMFSRSNARESNQQRVDSASQPHEKFLAERTMKTRQGTL